MTARYVDCISRYKYTSPNPAANLRSTPQQKHQKHQNSGSIDRMTGQQPPEQVAKEPVHQKKRRRTKGPKPQTKPFTDGLADPVRLLPMNRFTFKPIIDVAEKEAEPSGEKKTPAAPAASADQPKIAVPPVAPAQTAQGPQGVAQGAPVPANPGAPGAPAALKDEEKKKVSDARLPKTKAYHKQLRAYNNNYGTRRYVQFIVCVGPDPRILLFKTTEEFIPGGFLKHDEEEADGVRRLWKELFHVKPVEPVEMDDEVESMHVAGQWHRPDSADQIYPYKSRYLTNCKEQIKTYLVELKQEMQIRYPAVFKELLVTDLYDVYDMKNPIVSSIPYLLSRFTFTS